MEIQKVIQLIRDLTNRTVDRGATEAEAMQAAEKIGELLRVYNLSMDKVFLGSVKCVTERIPTGKRRRDFLDSCILHIAAFCDCKSWASASGRGINGVVYSVFGLETDVAMALYLAKVVRNAVESESRAYRKSEEYATLMERATDAGERRGRGRHLVISFQRGMASRISNRLSEMTDARRAEEEKEIEKALHPQVQPAACVPVDALPSDEQPKSPGSVCTSMIVVKRKKVDEEYEKLGLRLVNHHGSYTHRHTKAWSAGAEAGDRVNLSRPISGSPAGYLT